MPQTQIMFKNSLILDKMWANNLDIGYIKGYWSQVYSPPTQNDALTTLNQTLKMTINDGQKAKYNKKTKKWTLMDMNNTKKLDYYIKKYGEFTIVEMDVYWDGFENGGMAVELYRNLSEKPTAMKGTFNEVPLEELFRRIKNIAKQLGLSIATMKRLRDTVLIKTETIGTGAKDCTPSFYTQMMGTKFTAIIPVTQNTKGFTGTIYKY
jgi:hypothetical protein